MLDCGAGCVVARGDMRGQQQAASSWAEWELVGGGDGCGSLSADDRLGEALHFFELRAELE
jgi:hypothetical protein